MTEKETCGFVDVWGTSHEDIVGHTTACGEELFKQDYDDYNYCPYCGKELVEK